MDHSGLGQFGKLLPDWLGNRIKPSARGTRKASSSAAVPVYELSYEYGDLMVRDGVFRSPCEPDSQCPLCEEVRKAAEYSHIPLAVVVDGLVEVFITEDRNGVKCSIPINVMGPGEMFGVFEVLEIDGTTGERGPRPRWSVSAGARSVHLVWKSKERGSIDRLLKVIRTKPGAHKVHLSEFGSDWDYAYAATHKLVRAVAPALDKTWNARIVLVPREWLVSEDEEGRNARLELYRLGWRQTRGRRREFADLAALMRKADPRNFSGDVFYLYRTVMHLLSVASGESPGYVPVHDDKAGPFRAFQQFLLAEGICTDRYPAMVRPAHIGPDIPYAFYSVNWPSLLGAANEERNIKTFVDNLARAVSPLMEITDAGALDGFSYYAKPPVDAPLRSVREIDDREFVPESALKLQKESHEFFSGLVRIERRVV
ncbi:MAG: hypothetical protein IPJ24_04045 [bacterium]|nr:hypothetical protein [bacterium]